MRNCADRWRGAAAGDGASWATGRTSLPGDAATGGNPGPKAASTAPQDAANPAHTASALSARPRTILPALRFPDVEIVPAAVAFRTRVVNRTHSRATVALATDDNTWHRTRRRGLAGASG